MSPIKLGQEQQCTESGTESQRKHHSRRMDLYSVAWHGIVVSMKNLKIQHLLPSPFQLVYQGPCQHFLSTRMNSTINKKILTNEFSRSSWPILIKEEVGRKGSHHNVKLFTKNTHPPTSPPASLHDDVPFSRGTFGSAMHATLPSCLDMPFSQISLV